jgi:hypothetical protein
MMTKEQAVFQFCDAALKRCALGRMMLLDSFGKLHDVECWTLAHEYERLAVAKIVKLVRANLFADCGCDHARKQDAIGADIWIRLFKRLVRKPLSLNLRRGAQRRENNLVIVHGHVHDSGCAVQCVNEKIDASLLNAHAAKMVTHSITMLMTILRRLVNTRGNRKS